MGDSVAKDNRDQRRQQQMQPASQPASQMTFIGSEIDRAIQRDRLIQERALEIVKSFGPQIGSGSGMQPSHFIHEAFRFAEAFTAICDQRELAIQVELEPKP